VFKKILIANRGEIACRVIRTCKRLGIRTVAVYSDADVHAQHVLQADEAVRLGGPRPAESYLRGDLILDIAKRTGAEAIHPGYGFLSENEAFAAACEKAGVVFIGPTADSIEKMGSKSAAKALMEKANVPVVPGYHGDNQDPAFLAEQSKKVGYPQLIKAVAGGGGKGMRLVESSATFVQELDAAKREAKNAFGDDAVLIERYIIKPHHIEFQVFGDGQGNAVHLFERECSIQRRHQKVLEETPSPFIEKVQDDLRARMGEAAVAAAKAINYRGAGTIEFIVGEDRSFFFMEMNTRLQVEHPITEMITGEDLVEWQLRIAAGEPLPLTQSEILTGGHAIELRLCAESPAKDFLPETGLLEVFATPSIDAEGDVRLDTGVVSKDTISVYYDSMIAKLIAWGADRDEAIRRIQSAVAQTEVIGVKTNLSFLQRLVGHPAFIAGDTDTGFIATHRADLLAPQAMNIALLAAACARVLHDDTAKCDANPWSSATGWRLNAAQTRLIEFKEDPASPAAIECWVRNQHGLQTLTCLGETVPFSFEAKSADVFDVRVSGAAHNVHVIRSGDQLSVVTPETRIGLYLFDPYYFEPEDSGAGGRLTALMPGRVVKVLVAAGAEVKKGQPLLIMEAMKMEHTITSPRAGVIERVAFDEGAMVPADAVLFAFQE
jgi:3-methylcrotonyl-CoA carboxylase alpha subunit